MNKKRSSIILAIIFLVQGASSTQTLGAENYALSPASKISEQSFQQISTLGYITVKSYEKEVFSPAFRADIAGELAQLNSGSVRFDFRNMSRKGLICFYPITIGDKSFLIRAFVTAKAVERPDVKVLYEMKIDNPAVTCQVLPSVNDILKDCRVGPHRIYYDNQAAMSP